VIRTARCNEDRLLLALRESVADVSDKRREAERLYMEALAQEWAVDRRGRWLMSTADGLDARGFGLQPAPTGKERRPSPQWRLSSDSLRRPWHKRRPWNLIGDGSEAA
jgi:hypothetical protein